MPEIYLALPLGAGASLKGTNSMTIFAHDWNILKGERIPRWPSKCGEKRPLRVEINSWIGICPGAKHYYAKVREEDNQWWSEDENAWVQLSCDSARGGYSLEADVMTEEEAIELAKYFVLLVAGKRREHHEIIWSGPGRPRWAH